MKVRSSIKRRTKDCQIVIRKGKRFVINKKNSALRPPGLKLLAFEFRPLTSD